MKPDVVIWHGPHCQDGQAAAWALWQKWPDVEFIPSQYGDPPPDVTGKRVLLVDFSYKRDVLEEMAQTAAGITILDHHKSAQEDLAPFAKPSVRDFSTLIANAQAAGELPIQALFDMKMSGSLLAWRYAWGPYSQEPLLIQYVNDRDLWLFKLEDTKAICAVLFSHDFDFQRWNDLGRQIEVEHTRNILIREGEAILRSQSRDRAQAIAATQRMMDIGGYTVPVINVPKAMASDAAGEIAAGHPFGASYFDRGDGSREFSLRRRDGEVDVSKIAELFGGGGHAAAAGFRIVPGVQPVENANLNEVVTKSGTRIVIEGEEKVTPSGKKITVM